MGLFRLILLMAIVWFAWRVLSRALHAPGAPPQSRGGEPEYHLLTRCTQCGAHIPQPANGAPAICERCRSR